jgi:hypothetical protein
LPVWRLAPAERRATEKRRINKDLDTTGTNSTSICGSQF